MSLYAEYLIEKTNDYIIESEKGFLTYRYTDKETVYIIDLYIKPEFRRSHEASALADGVVKEAKLRGCKKLIGSVIPSNKSSNQSLKVLLGYGMVLDSSTNDFILFKKEI